MRGLTCGEEGGGRGKGGEGTVAGGVQRRGAIKEGVKDGSGEGTYCMYRVLNEGRIT